MHTYTKIPTAPATGAVFHLYTQPPYFKSNINNCEVGSSFVDTFCLEVLNELFSIYVEEHFTGASNLASLYAKIYKDIELTCMSSTDFIITGLRDGAEKATDMHPEWAETILRYFDYDDTRVINAVLEMNYAIHEVIFYPVMNMLNTMTQSGLVVSLLDGGIFKNNLTLELEVMDSEYSYNEYNNHSFTHTPFRLQIPRVRTINEIGYAKHRNRVTPIHPMVYPFTPSVPEPSKHINGNYGYVGEH